MKASITIISKCDDELNSYFAEGDLCIADDGFILSYILDEKDENNLVYNGKSICQSRTGGLTYSVEFIQGQKCSFLFTEMGFSFSREVEVHRVKVSSDGSGCKIQIIYSDCGMQGNVTNISIIAKYKNN